MISHLARSALRPLAQRTLPAAQRRALGTSRRGKDITNIAGQWTAVKELVAQPGITYVNYKYQVDAARVFLFGLTVAGISLDLILNPPRSSYFQTWGFMAAPGNLIGVFSKTQNEVFYQDASEYEYKGIAPWDAYKQLSTKRRLDSEVAEE